MQELSLRQLQRAFIAVTLVLSMLFLGAAGYHYNLVTTAEKRLLTLEALANPRVQLLASIEQRLGYGGMIHNFKNFVLRGGAEERRVFDTSAGAVLASLDELETRLPEAFSPDVATVRAMVREYQAQLGTIAQIRELDGDVEAIDNALRVNDGPAKAALASLRAQILGENPEVDETKAHVLFRINHELGYGAGMIHSFKNYVIRKDPRYAVEAAASMNRALGAITDYRAMKLSDQERAAIDIVAEAINVFMARLDEVSNLIEQGATAAEIDAVVRYTDGPAVAALALLASSAYGEVASSKQGLHRAIDILKHGAVVTGFVVLLMALVFSIGFWWVTERFMVAPATAIAEGLKRMAGGDTHIDLSAWAGESEIGQIARASGKFRKALVDNIRVGQDLAGKVLEIERLSQDKAAVDAAQDQMRQDEAALAEARLTRRSERLALHREIQRLSAAAELGDFSDRVGTEYTDSGVLHLAEGINRLVDNADSAFNEMTRMLAASEQGLKLDDIARGDESAAELLRLAVSRTLRTLTPTSEHVSRSSGATDGAPQHG